MSGYEEPADVEPRLKRVRRLKLRKLARGHEPDLTPQELDRVLPPVDCRRTRDRLKKQQGRT